jgi:hypothetical protein
MDSSDKNDSMDKATGIIDNKPEGSVDSSTDVSTCWNDTQETLLKGISERCNCMRWLHTQSNLHFDTLNFYFTIPNVIISTLNGSFTMALGSLVPDPEAQKTGQTIIGLISIFSAILITMNQYVKSQQMMEAHRASGLSYGKLYRLIMNELSLRRDQRVNGLEFLKTVRTEIDRLENTSPSILPHIIVRFNKQFANRDIEKPEITGDLDEVEINHEKTKRQKKGVLSLIKVPSFSIGSTPKPNVVAAEAGAPDSTVVTVNDETKLD